MLVDAALRVLSPRGPRGRLSVLIFHRVLPRADELHDDLPDAAAFDRTMAWVVRWFNVLPLDQAVRRWTEGSLPARAAAITFDDGYADNLTEAVPVLRRHGLPATFFITTGYLDGGRMWNDTVAESLRRCRHAELDLEDLGLGRHALADWPARRRAMAQLLGRIKYLPQAERQQVVDTIARRTGATLPDDLMLSTPQLRALRDAGMQIGAHTLTHPILARQTPDAAREEIAGGKLRLEALLQQPVTLFAYPNGVPGRDFLPMHAAMVREAGYEAAVTTAAGAANARSDRFQLPRFTPWDHTPLKFGLRMARNLMQQELTAEAAAT